MRCWIFSAVFIVFVSVFAGWREWHWRALDKESAQREFSYRQAIAEKAADRQIIEQDIQALRSDQRALNEALENEQARIAHRDTLVEMWQSRFRTAEATTEQLQQERDHLEEALRHERGERIAERRRQREQIHQQTAELESELALSRNALIQLQQQIQNYPFRHREIALQAVAGSGLAFAIERQSIADLPQGSRLLIFRGHEFIGTAQRAEQSPTHWLLHFSPDRTLRVALEKGDFLSIVWTTDS